LGVPPSPSEPIGAGQARAWSAFFLPALTCSANEGFGKANGGSDVGARQIRAKTQLRNVVCSRRRMARQQRK
jgi:hypothetical protein